MAVEKHFQRHLSGWSRGFTRCSFHAAQNQWVATV